MTTWTINGNTYSDDSAPGTRNLDNGGHRTWFPALMTDVAAVAAAADADAAAAALSAAQALGLAGTAITATSSTGLTIGTGTKILTIETGKAFVSGMPIRIGDAAAPNTNFMDGTVTTYNAGTGTLTASITSVGGSGTFSDWSVRVIGLAFDGTVSAPGIAFASDTDTGFRRAASGEMRAVSNGSDELTLLRAAQAEAEAGTDNAKVMTALRTAQAIAALAIPTLPRVARTSNTILGAADKAKLIDITSGTFTQTLTAAATLGAGWFCYLTNTGTGTVTVDPNASETIGGVATATLRPGDFWLIVCTGSAFSLFRLAGGTTVVLTSGTSYTVEAGVTRLWVQGWGGGGGGGRFNGTGPSAPGAGAGAYFEGWFNTTPGTAITYAIGAGGNGASTFGADGTAGGNTTFGGTFTANGGALGPGGAVWALPEGGTASGGSLNINGGYGTRESDASLSKGGDAPRGGVGGMQMFVSSTNFSTSPRAPGGGGAAGNDTNAGQAGAAGQIIISFV